METIRIAIVCSIFLLSGILPSPAKAIEFGLGIGKELRGNNDIMQFEGFIRQPLPYKWEFESGRKILSGVEIGGAMIQERHSDQDEAARISIMPHLIFHPHQNINFLMGLGAGFMMGNTAFTKHNLGGELLFASKVGIQFVLGSHWNLGYFFFHQSNGGMYEHNASLNMHQLELSFTF